MTAERRQTIEDLIQARYNAAQSHIKLYKSGTLRKYLSEEAEVPGFEDKKMKYGQFENKEFVVMMIDIRDSTSIINVPIVGLSNMFTIFYIYAAVVANIVNENCGTSTEFLGDGVLNLFDTDISREKALGNAMQASWDIMEATLELLNPFLSRNELPMINIGIGIDYGITIVTRFGFGRDNDIKAFGTCVYNVSKLCKEVNKIIVSDSAKDVWPSGPGGKLDLSLIVSRTGGCLYEARHL